MTAKRSPEKRFYYGRFTHDLQGIEAIIVNNFFNRLFFKMFVAYEAKLNSQKDGQ